MAYRDELRAWLEGQRIPRRDAPLDELRPWNALLFDAGYAAPSWPTRFGGRDAGLEDQLSHTEEMARADAPGPVNAIGVANIAPAILRYGAEEQQERFLRPMLRGDELWSQGMSEPGAGSDLASLRCAAVDVGDAFVVNGQKTWNSNGHLADWCQLYVRTDPGAAKHRGITCLLVDLALPGIEARPIRTMAGDVSFAELFLTDVRVPRSAMLGALHDGWAVATRTLSNERAGVASLYLAQQRTFDRLVRAAARPAPWAPCTATSWRPGTPTCGPSSCWRSGRSPPLSPAGRRVRRAASSSWPGRARGSGWRTRPSTSWATPTGRGARRCCRRAR